MPNSRGNGTLAYVSELRLALSECSQRYASAAGVPHRLSYGGVPAVVFEPDPKERRHGNFITTSYRAILRNSSWQRRLAKTHAQRKRLPQPANGCWSELDSCNSSDALLMNIFCYPRILAYPKVSALLGVNRKMCRSLDIERGCRWKATASTVRKWTCGPATCWLKPS